jgi:hypothetical protein
MHGVWRAARAITAFIGVLAFASALFVVLGFALGTIIS